PDMSNPTLTSPPPLLYERALTLAAMGFQGEAIGVLRDVTTLAPGHAPAWEGLARLRFLTGKTEKARKAISRAAAGLSIWKPALDSRTSAELASAERALLERA